MRLLTLSTFNKSLSTKKTKTIKKRYTTEASIPTVPVNWQNVDTSATNIYLGTTVITPREPVVYKDKKLTLNSTLPSDFISTRIGPLNRKIKYVTISHSVTLANMVFGTGNWSTRILETKLEFKEKMETGNFKVIYITTMRVSAVIGDKIVCHEATDVGTAQDKLIEIALGNSLKISQTKAFKKALERFGRVFIAPQD